tara:strand:- start:310 stop:480 length:171 start_codon:yes stop_codon:yes gene_type:complete
MLLALFKPTSALSWLRRLPTASLRIPLLCLPKLPATVLGHSSRITRKSLETNLLVN